MSLGILIFFKFIYDTANDFIILFLIWKVYLCTPWRCMEEWRYNSTLS